MHCGATKGSQVRSVHPMEWFSELGRRLRGGDVRLEGWRCVVRARGLRVFLRDPEPLAGVARRLEATQKGGSSNGAEAADGEVSMVLLLRNGSEVEVKLPGRFKVSPQIAGAIKAVSGVVTVEAL